MHSTSKTQLSDCNETEHTDKKNHRYFSLIKSTKYQIITNEILIKTCIQFIIYMTLYTCIKFKHKEILGNFYNVLAF